MKTALQKHSKLNDDDHVYYDVTFYNNSLNPLPLNIIDSRTLPLIKKPSDYHLSIIRFNLPSSYLPIFIWPATNPNSTYSVTIYYNGLYYQSYLHYVPYNNLATTAPNYYFVYSYQQLIDAINNAFNSAYIASGASPATQPPYIIFNPVTGLFSLIAEQNYDSTTGTYRVYMNQPLFAFFDNFPNIMNSPFPQAGGTDYQLLIKNTGNFVASNAPGYSSSISTTLNAYEIIQENYTLYLINSVRKVIITSSIPIITENLNIAEQQLTTTTNNTLKILTDFEVNLSNADWRSYIQYVPLGEYRLITMNGDTPLYQFDFSILFQTADQTIYQM